MMHVLAVEDSPTQAEALRSDLEEAGFQVSLARGGREALARLADGGVDLVVSDVVMPDMDGYELCKTIKSDVATAQLPVVLLTSLTDPLDVVHGLEAGADNFIRKPYQAQQLVARLSTTMHNRELRSTGRMQMGIELSFLDRRFVITAERQQILDLLISTFEELVVTSREVRQREEDLGRAHALVNEQLRSVEVERRRLAAVLDAVPVSMVVVDADGRISHASGEAASLFQVAFDAPQGAWLSDIGPFVDAEGQPLAAGGRPLSRALSDGDTSAVGNGFDVFLQRPDGTRVPVLLQASPFYAEHGAVAGAVGVAQVLGELALVDPLTGLPGSTAFADRVAAATGESSNDTAVLILAVDRLELARVASGVSTGDEFVATTARRLRTAVERDTPRGGRSRPFLAYLGAAQFGVVVPDARDPLEVYRLAELLRISVEDLAVQPAEDVTLSASVGVSVGSAPAEPGQLLAAAGTALRRAREAGGGRVEIFDRVASQEALARIQLEIDLRQAMERGEILLHFQPEIDLRTGRVVGFEALARWQHEQRGYVPPDVFIAIAEESGIIRSLGLHVLESACAQVKAWEDAGLLADDTHVAVNLSAVQLRPQLVEEVQTTLAAAGIDPRRLVLEVTETVAMADPEATCEVLARLRELGVRCALDDFGTGYSSLAYLNRIRFDQLKLDRTFVAGLAEGGPDAAIAQSVVALGHSLGVQVLAEGVETEEQAQALRALGCDLAQGYHFARPLTPKAVGEWLPANTWVGAVR